LTPTRYLYSHANLYLTNPITRYLGKILRNWDFVASTRPDSMISISTQVKNRIQKYYNRNSKIIFPPVDINKFQQKSNFIPKYQNYFLIVSRLVAYKKIDILIEACNQTRQTLVILGQGREMSHLSRLAGPTVHLLGFVADDVLVGYYQHCRALLQASEEDFGISMVEAQASGKPVIAYQVGGASDIVKPGETGILVKKQSSKSFSLALSKFDTMSFVPANCIKNATRFNTAYWKQQMLERIKKI
jgi:glycosyltransferase involved in cell wall biosynthesis